MNGNPTHPAAGDWSPRPSVCVVGSGWRYVSGISYYTCHLANAFANHTEVSAILMRRLLPKHLYPGAARVGLEISDLKYRPDVAVLDGVDWFWGLSMARALIFLVRRRPDVVIFQWWSGTVLHSYRVIAWVARLLGGATVIEFHEVLDTAEANIPFVGSYVRWGLRPLLRRSIGFAVHSEYDRSLLAKHYGIMHKPIVVIPHGPFDHGTQQDAKRPRTADQPVCVLFFGTIRPYKGLEHLIEAFNSLDPVVASRLSLNVVGETWENWTRPSELIRASPHRAQINFVNHYVTDAEANDMFLNADVVILPYLRSSASGPLHQAMSYGLPVVVSSVGGLTEAASAYSGATLVRPGDVDALRAILQDIATTVTGNVYASPYTWESSVDKFMALIKTGEGTS